MVTKAQAKILSSKPPPIGTAQDYEAIEKAAGLKKLDLEFRWRIASWVTLYADGPPRVRPGAVLKAVKQLRSDAGNLLRSLSLEERDEDEQALALTYAVGHLIGEGKRWELVSEISELAQRADAILNTMPRDKGGRLGNPDFDGLVIGLAIAYEEFTGKKAGVSYHGKYQGPFFRFVKECLVRLAPVSAKSDHALGKAIQRALKMREKGVVWTVARL